MVEFDRDAIKHLGPSIDKLGLFLDTYDTVNPEMSNATTTQEFLYYAEQSGTVASILGEEYEDSITGNTILSLTIRRTRLGEPLTPTEVEARTRYTKALEKISKSALPVLKVEARQVNDDDSDNNIQRGLNALGSMTSRPQATVLFEQSFKRVKPGTTSF